MSLDRPGYLGAFRDQRVAEWNEKFGVGNWRLGWVVNGLALNFLGACALYEDAYFEFLRTHWDILRELCSAAREVYDDAESNVGSGLDYTKQETEHTHIQDIAIRRALVRLGVGFTGSELVQIRGDVGSHPLSKRLSPGVIPFHRNDWIYSPQLKGWWKPSSVEAFYQSNKFLQFKEET